MRKTIAKRSAIELQAREQSMMLLLHNLEHVSPRRRRCGWIIWTLANFPVFHLHAQTRCDDLLVVNVLRKRSKEREICRSIMLDKKLIDTLARSYEWYVLAVLRATLEPLLRDARSLRVRIHGLMNAKAVCFNRVE